MSFEQEIGEALAAHAPLMALVGDEGLCLDEVPAEQPRPYVVYAKQNARVERGLDGSAHTEMARFDIQCVGETRAQTLALAAHVRAALEAAGQPPEDFGAGYDPDNDIEAETVSVDWWL